MNAKRSLFAWMTTLAVLGSASAQAPTLAPRPPALPPGEAPPIVSAAPGEVVPPSGMLPPVAGVGAPPPGFVPPPEGYAVPGVSNWIRRDGSTACAPCASLGADSWIGEELYFRAGPSFPLGQGEILSRNLAVGFTVQAGARSLFFNPEYTRAWVVDASISNSHNSGVTNGEVFVLPGGVDPNAVPPQQAVIPDIPVTIRSVNRTFVNLGFGREWFMQQALFFPAHVRFGVDGGGRWGSANVALNETGRRTDVIGGAYVGSHLLYEFGYRESILNFGVRTEYSYTWSDVFYRATDLNELNVLVNLGIRF